VLIVGPFLVFRVDFLLLVKTFFVLLLCVLFRLLGAHESIVKSASIIADLLHVALCDYFLAAEQLLQKLLFVK